MRKKIISAFGLALAFSGCASQIKITDQASLDDAIQPLVKVSPVNDTRKPPHLANAGQFEYDGCYLSYVNGTRGAAYCIRGTSEEGIAGSGALAAIFDADTNELAACAGSASVRVGKNSFAFLTSNNALLLEMSNVRAVVGQNGQFEGDLRMGRTSMRFQKLAENTAQPYQAQLTRERRCTASEPQLVFLRNR